MLVGIWVECGPVLLRDAKNKSVSVENVGRRRCVRPLGARRAIEETFTAFYVIKFYKLPLKVNLGPAPHSTLHKLHRIDYVSRPPATPTQCISRFYPARLY